MLVAEIRRERYETVHVVRRSPRGDFLEARSPDGVPAFLFVPSDMKLYEAECARMRMFRSPGVPEIREVFAGAAGTEAICMDGIPAARPLDSADVAPASVLRTGLVTLLSTLSHAHAHDFAHGRIAPDSVFIDTSGSLLLLDWTSARRVSDEPLRRRGIHAVARDVRALGAALLAWVGRLDGRGRAEMAPDVAEHASAIVAGEDPELARVLVRMASADPMEAYEYAGEALLDLGARDLSLGDPWLDLPLIGRGRMIRRIADAVTSVRDGERSGYSAVVEGAGGTGRTSVLREIARRCRERGHSVVHIEGRDTSAPWEPIASLARQLATRLPSDSPYRNAPEVRALLDAQSPEAQRHLPSGGEQVARTAYELASPRNPEVTVVLLDDEDALPSHILGAWREFEQLAAPAGASAAGSRPRFALIAATMAPAAPGDRRERHTLECLDERQVHKLVEWLLTVPPRAPIIADPLWRVTAGRPSEIAAYMRRLDRDGVVRRMARRWALLADEVQLGAEYLEDGVRRTLAALSPDATRMAELLAVLGGAGARRSDVIDIADIPAHRLQPVAYECERAGLAARTGTGWRIFTPARAERVLAGIGDDRRRALEREVLERYLDRAPGDQDPALLAHHARACSDPRAASFCRAAALAHVEALRYEQAARLLDDTIDAIDPAMADADLQVAYIEALVRRDRRTDVVARAEAVLNDPRLPDPVRDRIVLAAYRLSEGVLAPGFLPRLPVSDALRDPATRSEIRLWRARALALAGRDTECEREMRLAAAEMGDGERTPWIEVAEALTRAARSFEAMNWDDSAMQEHLALWRCRRIASRGQIIHGVYRSYRVQMMLRRESRAIQGVRRLRRRNRTLLRADRRLVAQVLDIEIYIEHWMGQHGRCSIRHMAAHIGIEKRDEPVHWVFSVAGLIQMRITHGSATWKDKRRTRELLWLLNAGIGRDVHFRFARCALFFGFHEALCAAASGSGLRSHTQYDQATITMAAVRARMLDGGALEAVLGVKEALALVAHGFGRDFGPDMLGTFRERIPCGGNRTHTSPGVLSYSLRVLQTTDRDVALGHVATVGWTSAPGCFETEDLVLTLLTERLPQEAERIAVSQEAVDLALAQRVPMALEWRRLLRLAVEARSEHRIRDSECLIGECLAAIGGIRETEIGPMAAALRVAARQTVATWGFDLPEPIQVKLTEGSQRAVAVAAAPVGPLAPPTTRAVRPWGDLVRAVASGDVDLISCGGLVEMDAFVDAALETPGMRASRTAAAAAGAVGEHQLLVGIDAWVSEDLKWLLRRGGLSATRPRATLLLMLEFDAARRDSNLLRCVIDGCCHARQVLENPLLDPTLRVGIAMWQWRRMAGDRRELPAALWSGVRTYNWPGGFGELVSALNWIGARPGADPGAALREWFSTGASSRGGRHGDGRNLALQVEAMLRTAGTMSLSAVAQRTSAPRRSLQRTLMRLVDDGVAVRVGRGRATAYRLQS